MRSIFRDQLGPLAEVLSPDPEEARTRAGLVASQVLGMALCRYVLELPPVVALTPEEVVRWLAPTVQGYLAGEAPPPPPPEDG
jgi:tetracycline repressor-like protein